MIFVIHSKRFTPPPKYYQNNLPRIFLCNFWGRLRQNCVITKKLIPQELFCVIGDRRDLRLVHVELREIYVTPKKYFSENFLCNWLRDTVAITPKIIPQDFFCVSNFFEGGMSVGNRLLRMVFFFFFSGEVSLQLSFITYNCLGV